VVDSGLETIASSILLAAICQGFNDFQGGGLFFSRRGAENGRFGNAVRSERAGG
jgi:hypothetical protein